MRNISILTFLSFLLASITTTAFEDGKTKSDLNFIYKLNANLDDLVLNYCTTYDSYTVNRLYSQKKIINKYENSQQLNRFLVSLKKKPLNPNLIELIIKKPDMNFLNQNINEADLNYLSN